MQNIHFLYATDVYNTKAAKAFMPFLNEIIEPQSVIDIGCGLGTWLKVFQENGVVNILGVDGAEINVELLAIERKAFHSHNLCETLNLGKKFDLALCLEVAEHLPLENSDNIIDSVVNHSDVILFSAALPKQGGQNHVNEQPFSFWVKKFNERGFVVRDTFRAKIWDNENIDWWYRQNIFLVERGNILNQEKIPEYYHPMCYSTLSNMKDDISTKLQQINQGNISFYQASKILMKTLFFQFRKSVKALF
jgi:SAM-dependent methyltransferase